MNSEADDILVYFLILLKASYTSLNYYISLFILPLNSFLTKSSHVNFLKMVFS